MSKRPAALQRLARAQAVRAVLCFGGLAGFLTWACLAPLEEGVSAQGAVVAADDRQVVQHLEGGIIEKILVEEGSKVEKGAPLIVLQKTASAVERDRIVLQVAILEASVARLTGLSEEATAPDFSSLDTLALPEDMKQRVVTEQTALFGQQRAALKSDLEILSTRSRSARLTASARAQQIASAEAGLVSLAEQVSLTKEMVAGKIARLDKLQELEQRYAQAQADLVRLKSERDQSGADATDLEAQLGQARVTHFKAVSEELLETRLKLDDLKKSLGSAEDILSRTTLIAPHSGEVLNLAFTTEGGVIRPSETIMEIVPETGDLTASIRIRPIDRPSVFKGQKVRTKFVSYKSWTSPQYEGTVVSVSADLKTDPATGAKYYEARIVVPDAEADRFKDGAQPLSPGMPVEAFIFSGRSRTLADYVIEPVMGSISKGFRS